MVRHLVFGGDREMSLSLMVLTLAMVYAVGGVWAKIGFVVLAGIAQLGLRALARIDPWYVPIMIRSRTLVGRYPARGSPTEIGAAHT